eukprot:gene30298-35286_t
MEIAKQCQYCGLEATAGVVFGIFVASWAALRLITYPWVIIRSSLFE